MSRMYDKGPGKWIQYDYSLYSFASVTYLHSVTAYLKRLTVFELFYMKYCSYPGTGRCNISLVLKDTVCFLIY